MPTDLFYTINFFFAILVAILALIVSVLIIIIFLINRRCRTIANLMTCNTVTAIIFYFIIYVIAAIYGLRDDWAEHQPACVFRAYCYVVSNVAICYSHVMHAISRLFFVIFYKKRVLLQWRVHWLMIIINWLVSVTVTIVPFFVKDAYGLQRDSRICTMTSKIFLTSAYTATAGYLIPFGVLVVIYSIIFYKARQSTLRVMPAAIGTNPTVTNNNNRIPNIKREIQLIKTMLVLIGAMTFAGTLYLILIFWHLIRPQPGPPQPLYLLSFNLISVALAFMAIVLFWMNRGMKKCAFQYLKMLYECSVQ